MRVEVSRTSRWDGQPIPEAREEQVLRTDTRTVDDPNKIPAYKGRPELWYGTGTNHRVENGQIKRDNESIAWVMDCTWEDIYALFKREGSLIIEESNVVGCLFALEIYDDCRE